MYVLLIFQRITKAISTKTNISTKADWHIIGEDTKEEIIKKRGIHPSFLNEQLEAEIKEAFLKADIQHIDEVFFYGSGCLLPQNKDKVKEFLQHILQKAPFM